MIDAVNNEFEAENTTGTHSDVLVVGAGIIGLAHAARALDRGLTVTVIDRDHRAVGASVRNFGHCCITAQSGELYDLAQGGRELWLHYAEQAGFWAAETGAVVVARTQTELDVLTELAAVREPGQIVLLTPDQLAQQLGRRDASGLVGGAWLRDDLRVDPRTTVARLAAWADEQPAGQVHWNTSALQVQAGTTRRAAVRTSRGTYEADEVFICVGHDVDYLFPRLAETHRIQRCALQMARVKAPGQLELTPAVLTASSMLRYHAFTEVPSAARLREELGASHPQLLEIDANLMFTQRPDGTVLMGDSHSYAATQDPFLAETTSQTLLEAGGQVLGTEALQVVERWQGVYASSELGPLLVAPIREGVQVVSVTAGVGMTVCFGLAERNTAHLPVRELATR